MSPASAQLLAATWSWADGVLSVVLLGLLFPAAVGLTLDTALLGVLRRDWRLVPGALGTAILFGLAGVVALVTVQPPAPGQDYWLGLSLTLGALVLGAMLMVVARNAGRREAQNRTIRAMVQTPPDAAAEAGRLPKPAPRKHLNAVTAEHYVAEWMQHLGAADAVVTPFRRDGGVDVRSSRFVAQVKHRTDLVGVAPIRELIGVAGLQGREALFFSTSPYSRDAIAAASAGKVALFIVRPREGELVAANALAHQLKAAGLGRPAAPRRVPALVEPALV